MKLTSPRFAKLVSKLRAQLIVAVKQDSPKLPVIVNRLNRVFFVQRQRNLSNGMPGKPWVNLTIDQVKNNLIKKGQS